MVSSFRWGWEKRRDDSQYAKYPARVVNQYLLLGDTQDRCMRCSCKWKKDRKRESRKEGPSE